MKLFLVMGFILTVLWGAGLDAAEQNIFTDTILQTIYTLQNQRDSEGLTVYLKDKNPLYRRAAATAFASVQAVTMVEQLAALLEDEDESVRLAAAYALGQIGDKTAEPLLISAFDRQLSLVVKGEILEALGKCGTEKGLTFITSLQVLKPEENGAIIAGQVWGLYRFGVRTIFSPQGTALAVSCTAATQPENVRFAAANYLSRIKGIALKEHEVALLSALDQETNLNARMTLAAAIGKVGTPAVATRLKALLDTPVDSRIKINALRGLGAFEYDSVKESFFRMVAHKDVNIAITASEYLLEKGKPQDGLLYFETAKKLYHWRSRANLLGAALKFTPETDVKNRKRIRDWIDAAYKKSANTYEKAWLLTAMTWDLQNYMLVRLCTFDNRFDKTGGTVLSTNGIQSLVDMFTVAKKAKKLDDKTLQDFIQIFQRAIQSRDPALITTVAAILRDPDMELKNAYPDTTFLADALKNCQLPSEGEAWLELKKTLDYFQGKSETPAVLPTKNHPLDWALVKTIAPDQRVRIKTSKGDILIRLFVNESPGSVANFVQLIRQGFYKNGVFHRVVPNFVIQDGCPRGDGSGGPLYTIGSEFAPLRFKEGSVGMASSGKDTEGSQWFITHSPAPHLDGRYTNFAIVESGFDVIARIEVGDRVLSYKEI